MRRLLPLLAMALASSACTAPTAAGGTATTSVTVEAAPTATSIVEDATPSTTTTLTPNVLTVADLERDAFALMSMEELPPPWTGWPLQSLDQQSNVRIAQLTVQNPTDEASDAETFGRLDGVRAVHRPRFSGGQVVAVENWVTEFRDDTGASGYLADFVGDVAKGEDAGRTGNFTVAGVDEFAIDVIGDEARGLVITEAPPEGETMYETVVGFRLGRLLGFVSILRLDDADTRIPAQRLAETLEARMYDVLEGRIVPEVIVEPVPLTAYAFTYEQTLTERYSTIIFPPQTAVDDSDGGGGEGGEEASDGAGDDGATDGGDQASTTSSSSTTTTTRIVRVETTTRVASEGLVDGDDRYCDLTLALLAALRRKHYRIVDDKVWVIVPPDDAPIEVDPDDVNIDADLIYCPGWPVDLAEGGIDDIVEPGTGEPVELDGIPAERFDLDALDLAEAGLGPEGGRGVNVNRFIVWLARDEPWVIGVDLRFSGTTNALEPAIGPGFHSNASISIGIEFRASRLNDPTIEIEPAVTDVRPADDQKG